MSDQPLRLSALILQFFVTLHYHTEDGLLSAGQFSPSGKWLIAANQDTDNLAAFAFDAATGALTFTGHTLACGSPNFVAACPTAESLAKHRMGTSLRAPVPHSESAEF